MLLLVGLLFVAATGVVVLAAFGRGLMAKGQSQRAADLAAISAARAMHDNYNRLFEPVRLRTGRLNPRHLERDEYLAMARSMARRYARRNGVHLAPGDVSFPDGDKFAPVRVRVKVRSRARVTVPGGGHDRGRVKLPIKATAVAEVGVSAGDYPRAMPEAAAGGGYNGPLAYRQGKGMRPDVARAFDRMAEAARRESVSLLIISAYRSDKEQARLFARNPNPRWVAPPGKSLHRLGTELDLGPPSAYGWLARSAGKFGFIKRYSWEPWHYGFKLNPRSTPDRYRRASPEGRRSHIPGFVPATYVRPIAKAASRWNVSAALLAAQLYAESNFNPFAQSPAGARGIAQFMPSTARTYGLIDPFDAGAAINAQAHLMRDLLRRFASVPLALAAYNAGAGAVARYGGIPPYPETRAYVARILALMGGTGFEPAPILEVRLVS